MTLIDVLDEKGNKTGEKFTKPEIHERGLWHAAAHIWIYNKKGEVLLQKRALVKDSYPGLWDISAAGHVDSGEAPIQGAIRELEEEIGLKASESDLVPIESRKIEVAIKEIGWQNNEFIYLYLLMYDGQPSDLVLKEDEISEVRFISQNDFLKEINDPLVSKTYAPIPLVDAPLVISKINERLCA